MTRVWQKGNEVVLQLTALQADALHSLCNAANKHGDHEDWLKSAMASRAEIYACRQMMELAQKAVLIANAINITKSTP